MVFLSSESKSGVTYISRNIERVLNTTFPASSKFKRDLMIDGVAVQVKASLVDQTDAMLLGFPRAALPQTNGSLVMALVVSQHRQVVDAMIFPNEVVQVTAGLQNKWEARDTIAVAMMKQRHREVKNK